MDRVAQTGARRPRHAARASSARSASARGCALRNRNTPSRQAEPQCERVQRVVLIELPRFLRALLRQDVERAPHVARREVDEQFLAHRSVPGRAALLKPCRRMWFSNRHTYSLVRSALSVHEAFV